MRYKDIGISLAASIPTSSVGLWLWFGLNPNYNKGAETLFILLTTVGSMCCVAYFALSSFSRGREEDEEQ